MNIDSTKGVLSDRTVGTLISNDINTDKKMIKIKVSNIIDRKWTHSPSKVS